MPRRTATESEVQNYYDALEHHPKEEANHTVDKVESLRPQPGIHIQGEAENCVALLATGITWAVPNDLEDKLAQCLETVEECTWDPMSLRAGKKRLAKAVFIPGFYGVLCRTARDRILKLLDAVMTLYQKIQIAETSKMALQKQSLQEAYAKERQTLEEKYAEEVQKNKIHLGTIANLEKVNQEGVETHEATRKKLESIRETLQGLREAYAKDRRSLNEEHAEEVERVSTNYDIVAQSVRDMYEKEMLAHDNTCSELQILRERNEAYKRKYGGPSTTPQVPQNLHTGWFQSLSEEEKKWIAAFKSTCQCDRTLKHLLPEDDYLETMRPSRKMQRLFMELMKYVIGFRCALLHDIKAADLMRVLTLQELAEAYVNAAVTLSGNENSANPAGGTMLDHISEPFCLTRPREQGLRNVNAQRLLLAWQEERDANRAAQKIVAEAQKVVAETQEKLDETTAKLHALELIQAERAEEDESLKKGTGEPASKSKKKGKKK